jgi:putative oxidoreductase
MSNDRSCCEKVSPYFLSLLRLVIGVLILCHGSQKIIGYPATRAELPEAFTLAWCSGMIESIGGLLLVLGLFTRVAAFFLSGEMAVAYFMVHARQGWWPIHNKGELAVIFCFVFLYLSVAGGGPISVDGWWKCRKKSTAAPEATT